MFESTAISFLWPRLLWVLLAVPLAVLIYGWIAWRRRARGWRRPARPAAAARSACWCRCCGSRASR